MAGRCLLQVLLLAFVFESQSQNSQSGVIHYPHNDPVHFPTDGAAINRYVAEVPHQLPPQPLPQSVRATAKPRCARSNDLSDLDFPCVADDDYDDNIRNLVNRLIVQSQSINEIVNDPMLKVLLNDTLTAVVSPGSPSTRFGGVRETPVCFSQEELIYPQRAKTPKDDWVFVVNQDNVKQALRVERCIGKESQCNFGQASTQDISTVCRQKYVYRRMLVLGTNNIQPEEVLMPSCCVCYTRRNNFDISSRIGNGTTPDEGDMTSSSSSSAQPVNSGQLHFVPSVPGQGQGQGISINRPNNDNVWHNIPRPPPHAVSRRENVPFNHHRHPITNYNRNNGHFTSLHRPFQFRTIRRH